MNNEIFNSNLPLPSALVRAMENGVWKSPKKRDVWRALFADHEISDPMLYPLSECGNDNPWGGGGLEADFFLGHRDSGHEPGDIDRTRSIVIADLGAERPIALDYRQSETRPSVVAFSVKEGRRPYWRKVSDDIESFMRALQLID